MIIKHNQIDVAIIGGGMVGLAAAAMLPKQLRIGLFEQADLSVLDSAGLQEDFNVRSTAIASSSQLILEEYGLWHDLGKFAQPIESIQVSRKNGFGSVLIEPQEQSAQRPLGYVLSNQEIMKSFFNLIKKQSHIDIYSSASLQKVVPKQYENHLMVSYQEEQCQISAKLIIIADGVKSKVAKQLGIDQLIKHYHQKAIIANVETSAPHQGRAFERFTDLGPMALLPLPSFSERHRSALVWTAPNEEIARLIELEDDAFLKAMQVAWGSRLGRFKSVGSRVTFPLLLSQAMEQYRNRLIIFGNAAHNLHPVAGQGFNLSLRDIASFVTLCRNELLSSKLNFDVRFLEQWYIRQQKDQKLTISFSDKLPEIFKKASLLGDLGLVIMDSSPEIKSSFIQFAAGQRRLQSMMLGK